MPDRNSSLEEWNDYGCGRIFTHRELVERAMAQILSPDYGAAQLGRPIQVELAVSTALHRLVVQIENAGLPDGL